MPVAANAAAAAAAAAVAVLLAQEVTPAGAINAGGFPNNLTDAIRGWRSWNAVMADVTQEFVLDQVHAITARRHEVDGVPTSLADLGYDRVGIDSGWSACSGPNGSWHDATGQFIVNTSKFPNMKAMVDQGHALGVKMDFYLNQDIDPGWHGCKSEGSIPGAAANTGNFASYALDVAGLVALGFDGVKYDAGGGNDDMNRWARELNASGRQVLIENCNNGGYVPYPPPKHAGGGGGGGGHGGVFGGDALADNCPFNMFRTGIDNAPSPLSTISNLVDMARYLTVSRPGCYAYPDMLELGAPVVGPRAARPTPAHPDGRPSACGAGDGTVGDTAPRLSLEQGKAQFAAWCSVSAPLILGFDLSNETEYDRWFPVVSNALALQIQAGWAGLAGKQLAAGPPFRTVVPHGATCEDMQDTRNLPSYSAWGKPVPVSMAGPAAGSSGAAVAWAIAAISSTNESAAVAVALADLPGLGPQRGGQNGSGGGGTDSGVHETDVWTGVTVPVSGTSWQAQLAPGTHRFVLLHRGATAPALALRLAERGS